MVKWTIYVSDDIDKAMRAHLTRTRMPQNECSKIVEEALKRYLFALSLDMEPKTQETQQDIINVMDYWAK